MRPYGYTSRRSGTDAQTVRPYSRYTSRFDTTDAQTVRPYSGYTSELHYSSCFDGDGRTSRASLQELRVGASLQVATREI